MALGNELCIATLEMRFVMPSESKNFPRFGETPTPSDEVQGGLAVKREDFASFQAWERYIVERTQSRRHYERQGFWCLAIVVLFAVTAIIK